MKLYLSQHSRLTRTQVGRGLLLFALIAPYFPLTVTVSAQQTPECWYRAPAPPSVTDYSCKELAERHGITVEKFFVLNPMMDPDCSSISANEMYCVSGTTLIVSPDGNCGPNYPGVTCLGYSAGSCCNGATFKCGGASTDCEPGGCYSGNCERPPHLYSSDGTCGPTNGNKLCGKWGECCNQNGECGTGTGYCNQGSCSYGKCDFNFPVLDPNAPLPYPGNTTDGTCGGPNGFVCSLAWGKCCSAQGTCGTGAAFCGLGCQPRFGNDCDFAGKPSQDGTCGGAKGSVCPGSSFGDCCSSNGFCGSTEGHCLSTAGCQTEFGFCTSSTASPDGTCGGTNGYTCEGTEFGDCCSATGFCGSTDGHCKTGCQTEFGTCTGASDLSPDGSCGGTNGYKCKDSGFGDCCSATGYCGNTDGHCKAGCQTAFGTCTGANISPDGSCGGTNGYTCKDSGLGDCCSATGWCGSSDGHCKAGCQTAFGTCTGANISPDGSCGGTSGFTCTGSTFGTCCSANGYCGSTTDHCRTTSGCQSAYGTCTASSVSPDGSCGATSTAKYTCAGSTFGNCCSAGGYCGSTTDHCRTTAGCQSAYGTCTTSNISPDGSCGGSSGYTCTGSTFGTCCSAGGYCGVTPDHCGTGTGCQSSFGTCTTLTTSPDGSCGGTNKYKCSNSGFGNCCSAAGYCGSTAGHCNTSSGCQSAYGTCTTSTTSPDGTCGGTNKYKCNNSGFGNCCSAAGYCGSTSGHCGSGCQSGFGTCT